MGFFLFLNFLNYCVKDTGVIVVKDALYGRRDSETCIKGRPQSQISNTHCSLEGALDVIKLRYTFRVISLS